MNITVAGSGSWGTALALCLVDNGHNVTLWSHDPQKAEKMKESGLNPALKDIPLPSSMKISADCACAKESEMVVIASPSFAIRSVCRAFAPNISSDAVVVTVTKGIERGTLLRMSQIAEEETGRKVVALTGPSHAEEVARRLPTACLAACPDRELAEKVQDAFMSSYFRIYTSPDIIGAELGGAIKNVMALCAGFSDGMGFGDNTKSMLITRGLTEMARLGIAMGARQETFVGLSGVGDLTVTCTSPHSRNCRAGTYIGQGLSTMEAMEKAGGVVEGYYAAASIHELAEKFNVDMPIVNAAYSVLYDGMTTANVIENLMNRSRKAESQFMGWE